METVNQETTTANQEPAAAEAPKTFTQEEVNAMFDKRFAKQWEKYGNLDELKAKADRLDQMEEASKTELQKATDRADKLQKELDGMKQAAAVQTLREKVSAETGVPVNLLFGETEEACTEQAKAILAFAKPSYPNVPDGGEMNHSTKRTTAEQFADWFNNF